MPLIFEMKFPGQDWRRAGTLIHGGLPGSVSHVTAGGQRELLLFECAGDRSVVCISRGGADGEAGFARIAAVAAADVVATLEAGEEFEMPVTSDQGISYQARWRHETP